MALYLVPSEYITEPLAASVDELVPPLAIESTPVTSEAEAKLTVDVAQFPAVTRTKPVQACEFCPVPPYVDEITVPFQIPAVIVAKLDPPKTFKLPRMVEVETVVLLNVKLPLLSDLGI